MEIKELAKAAKKEGICVPGLKRILASNDKELLLDYFIEGLDFCLEHDFPSKDFLKQEGGSLLGKHGIYIDEVCTIINRQRAVILGGCDASISAQQYCVSDIFLKHTSKAKVFASDHAFVRIDAFGSSELKVSATGDAKVFINVYGDAKVTYEKQDRAQVKVMIKGKESY